MEKQRCPARSEDSDHRSLSARIKRESTRLRILEATMRVFARSVDDTPVIEDVVKEANIARGTFYKYFDSLDQALVATGTLANDRMIADIKSVYEFLKEPWQRVCVGFRVYMVRALQDPSWAAFITRMDTWSQESIITQRMARDLGQGKRLGQFDIDDIDAAVDFIKGASLGGVYAVSHGVPSPSPTWTRPWAWRCAQSVAKRHCAPRPSPFRGATSMAGAPTGARGGVRRHSPAASPGMRAGGRNPGPARRPLAVRKRGGSFTARERPDAASPRKPGRLRESPRCGRRAGPLRRGSRAPAPRGQPARH